MKKTNLIVTVMLLFAAATANVTAQSYWTAARQIALTDALVSKAFNPTWFRGCVEEAGGIMKVYTFKKVILAGPGAPAQYHLIGKQSCGYGAHQPMHFMIEQKGRGFRILADIGAANTVTILQTTHNGYRDLRIGSTSKAGREWDTNDITFNGSTYNTE